MIPGVVFMVAGLVSFIMNYVIGKPDWLVSAASAMFLAVGVVIFVVEYLGFIH